MRSPADTLTQMLHAVDARDWEAVRERFADTLHADYSSLSGAPAAEEDLQRHRRDGEVWRLYGHYVVRVVDERIAAMTLQVFFQEGNTALPAAAAARIG